MAHMSRMEACKRKMKGISLKKKEKRAEIAKMDPEEREELLKKKFAPLSLKEKVNLILWDFKLHQLPITKYSSCAQTLKEYLKEKPKNSDEIKTIIQKMGY